MELTGPGLFKSGGNPWSSYMLEVYVRRRGPQPLGTVAFEEIEAKRTKSSKMLDMKVCLLLLDFLN